MSERYSFNELKKQDIFEKHKLNVHLEHLHVRPELFYESFNDRLVRSSAGDSYTLRCHLRKHRN